MSTKTFNISFPKELADLIDKKAKEQFSTRSDFLRQSALQYIKNEDRNAALFALSDDLNNYLLANDISDADIDRAAKEVRQDYAKSKTKTTSLSRS